MKYEPAHSQPKAGAPLAQTCESPEGELRLEGNKLDQLFEETKNLYKAAIEAESIVEYCDAINEWSLGDSVLVAAMAKQVARSASCHDLLKRLGLSHEEISVMSRNDIIDFLEDIVVEVRNFQPVLGKILLAPNPVYKPFRYPWAYENWLMYDELGPLLIQLPHISLGVLVKIQARKKAIKLIYSPFRDERQNTTRSQVLSQEIHTGQSPPLSIAKLNADGASTRHSPSYRSGNNHAHSEFWRQGTGEGLSHRRRHSSGTITYRPRHHGARPAGRSYRAASTQGSAVTAA